MDKIERKNQDSSNWPLNPFNTLPTQAVLDQVTKNLPWYAYEAICRKPEEVGMSDSLQGCFHAYCHLVKDHFEQVAKDAPASATGTLSKIAEEASGLIDKLLEYVDKRLYPPDGMRYISADYPYRLSDLSNRWDTVVRKLNVCRSSCGKNQDGILEARQPVFLQESLWIWKYGRRYLPLLVVAAVIFLSLKLIVLPQFDIFGKIYTLITNIRP